MDELLELLDGQRQLISSQAARKSNLLLQHSKTGRGEDKVRKKLQLAQGVQAVRRTWAPWCTYLLFTFKNDCKRSATVGAASSGIPCCYTRHSQAFCDCKITSGSKRRPMRRGRAFSFYAWICCSSRESQNLVLLSPQRPYHWYHSHVCSGRTWIWVYSYFIKECLRLSQVKISLRCR